MQNQICCETCAYYTYDEEWECYVCEQNLDEDEYVRLVEGHYRSCPYYRDGDCYKIARNAMSYPVICSSSAVPVNLSIEQ